MDAIETRGGKCEVRFQLVSGFSLRAHDVSAVTSRNSPVLGGPGFRFIRVSMPPEC